MNLRQPQLYGTQFQRVDDHWVLYAVDPRITDDERADWACPSLAEARKQVDAMNAMEAANAKSDPKASSTK